MYQLFSTLDERAGKPINIIYGHPSVSSFTGTVIASIIAMIETQHTLLI